MSSDVADAWLAVHAGSQDVGGPGLARDRQPGRPDCDDLFRSGLCQHQLQQLRRRRRENRQGALITR